MEINIGDRVTFKPFAFEGYQRTHTDVPIVLTGTVIHVNEAHRHYTVEAECRGCRIRECFKYDGKSSGIKEKRI